jgi:hypothetical protein
MLDRAAQASRLKDIFSFAARREVPMWTTDGEPLSVISARAGADARHMS